MKIGAYVLVRTYSAGVHFGQIKSRDGEEIVLKDARRVWRWRGANTLNELSQKGPSTDWSRVSEPTPEILLKWIEVMPCSKAGVEQFVRVAWDQ
jgi:hypothetical protein